MKRETVSSSRVNKNRIIHKLTITTEPLNFSATKLNLFTEGALYSLRALLVSLSGLVL